MYYLQVYFLDLLSAISYPLLLSTAFYCKPLSLLPHAYFSRLEQSFNGQKSDDNGDDDNTERSGVLATSVYTRWPHKRQD